jgi:hypothetical protein
VQLHNGSKPGAKNAISIQRFRRAEVFVPYLIITLNSKWAGCYRKNR